MPFNVASASMYQVLSDADALQDGCEKKQIKVPGSR